MVSHAALIQVLLEPGKHSTDFVWLAKVGKRVVILQPRVFIRKVGSQVLANECQ